MTTVKSSGVDRIAAERLRQVQVEGFDSAHDDDLDDGELARAAICYATPIFIYADTNECPWEIIPIDPFPFERKWDKRPRDRHDCIIEGKNISPATRLDLLAKAGALIAAEIDRLLRAGPDEAE